MYLLHRILKGSKTIHPWSSWITAYSKWNKINRNEMCSHDTLVYCASFFCCRGFFWRLYMIKKVSWLEWGMTGTWLWERCVVAWKGDVGWIWRKMCACFGERFTLVWEKAAYLLGRKLCSWLRRRYVLTSQEEAISWQRLVREFGKSNSIIHVWSLLQGKNKAIIYICPRNYWKNGDIRRKVSYGLVKGVTSAQNAEISLA